MLALWEYFWDPAAWVPGEPEPEPEVVTGRRANEGGGYEQPLDSDYWETRERYIRRMLQVTEVRHAQRSEQPADTLPSQQDRSSVPLSTVGPSSDPAVALEHALREQAFALTTARSASTRTALKQAGARIVETSNRIARLRDQYELETLAILIASTI